MLLEESFGKNVKARTNHICINCLSIIWKDEIYHFNEYFGPSMRKVEIYKLHLKCVSIYYHKRSKSEVEKYNDHWEQWYKEVFV